MPQQLAHYEIKELLGEGSFAWVYRAYDQKFEQDIALKLLKPIWLSDRQAIARFKQEAKTTRKLHHSNIVGVYDVGESDGQIYLTQLLVEGETLAQRLTNNGRLKWNEVLNIVTTIGSALDYAHSEGIIHRDIKPANIFLGPDNKAYLGDFGLIRAVEGSASLSASGSMIGTGHYMAPEIWDGKDATPATDVYALSCVVFEMLTGEVLFEGSSMMAVLKKHADGPEFPDSWPPDVPDGVTEVLQRGLAKDPIERFSRTGEMLAALETLTIQPQTTKSAASPPVIPHLTPRQPELEKVLDRASQTISRLKFHPRIKGAIIGTIIGAIIGAFAVLSSGPELSDLGGGVVICGLAGAITGALGGGNRTVISVAVTGAILAAIIWAGSDDDPRYSTVRAIVIGGPGGAILGAIIGNIIYKIYRFVKPK